MKENWNEDQREIKIKIRRKKWINIIKADWLNVSMVAHINLMNAMH